MSITQDTFSHKFHYHRHKENYGIVKLVRCNDITYGISGDIPRQFSDNSDVLEIANLESAHIHHESYGFSVNSNGFKLGFTSYVCPSDSQLIDVISKNKIEEFFTSFHEELVCVKVCFIGQTEMSIE